MKVKTTFQIYTHNVSEDRFAAQEQVLNAEQNLSRDEGSLSEEELRGRVTTN